MSYTRSIRKQPFCWQEKSILRMLRDNFKGQELSKYRNLYLTLTQIDSDFNGKPVKWYTKTIATYSGLTRDWIPNALQVFIGMGIINCVEIRDDKGHVEGRQIEFCESLPEHENPNTLKPDTRKPDTRISTHKKILINKNIVINNNTKGKAPKKEISKEKKEEAKQVNEIMEVFREDDGVNDWIFGDIKERGAVKYLIKRIGFDKVKNMAVYSKGLWGKDYAPQITTPQALKYKMQDIINHKNKNKGGMFDDCIVFA